MELGPNQRAWVDALRSGKYKQGDMALQTDQTFCCLGVACDLARKAGVEVTLNQDNEITGEHLGNEPQVKDWLGLRNNSGVLSSTISLVSLNDSGISFEIIAATIVKNANKLFIDIK